MPIGAVGNTIFGDSENQKDSQIKKTHRAIATIMGGSKGIFKKRYPTKINLSLGRRVRGMISAEFFLRQTVYFLSK